MSTTMKSSKYICEKCGKEFKQKSHYTSHQNKKNPCINENKIKELVSIAIQEIATKNAKKIKTYKLKIVDEESNDDIDSDVDFKSVNIIKPLLKWVGGKTQILDELMPNFPRKINNYHEPFLGGGSVLLALLSCVKSGMIAVNGNIYAYDLNESLIYLYKNIQTSCGEFYDCVQNIINEFLLCENGDIDRKPNSIEKAKLNKENYYYWIRNLYNNLTQDEKKTVMGSALFLFLNKTGFRGVFRVGPNGYNVPYGHYNNPEIINKEHLYCVSELIQNVNFECCDFTTSLSKIEDDDFVYLDPPYAPETTTSFVKYTENGFGIELHTSLFKILHSLQNKKFMMSNSDASLVHENFDKNKYSVKPVLCKRSINSKNPGSKTVEVIIKNY